MLTLRYSRGALAVEISLVLSYMGEEHVITRITPADRARSARDEISRDTAHTGYQIRRAIDHHAEAVLALIPQSARHHGRTELPVLYATEEPVADSGCRVYRIRVRLHGDSRQRGRAVSVSAADLARSVP